MPTWRVVERLGDARYLAPSMTGWEQIAVGSMIPAGSQIATGRGGRLIVTQAANQLSAGTGSRFILPGWEPGGNLHQTAGWLRYRIADAPEAAFGIETPFLALLVEDAVVDVTVGDSETEVEVVRGRVRVKTLDGERQIDLHAGYTGYAGLQDYPLAVRRGPGETLQAVPATVIPALHPERDASAAAAPVSATVPAPASSMEASVTALVAPRPSVAGLDGPGPARPGSETRAVMDARPAAEAESTVPAGFVPAEPVFQQRAAADRERAAIRRRFDGLAAGLLDGLLPAPPADSRLNGR